MTALNELSNRNGNLLEKGAGPGDETLALFVLSGLLEDILLSSLLIGEKHNLGT
jgi:hypothetical protein